MPSTLSANLKITNNSFYLDIFPFKKKLFIWAGNQALV